MSTVTAQTYLTPIEYLNWERKAVTKHEYLDGEIVAMSGASNAHNIITMNTSYQLYDQLLDRDCFVYASDMRVRVQAPVSYFYPDITVVCGEPRFEDDVFDTLLNPTVVIEVLSPSTAAYDRREKFTRYQQIASLKEYILISQNRIHLEHHLRQEKQENQWSATEFQKLEDVVPVTSIECELLLGHVYRRVTFSD
ncbi:Uma2 family endonuclease [Candidatus Poribacteria bacterium]|nr:Uma2 family endonuclease [Candidatus Poribacteria bacterium]MYH82804.1 Uma2 family endonuclease [Candidatus Poribacteria bacterium]MYK94270.1 Uma2 family endonuclease [Candidatus Poribacteria bacterium]